MGLRNFSLKPWKWEAFLAFDFQSRLPSGMGFLSPPKMQQLLSFQSQISVHFFYFTKEKKNLSVKLSPQIYSPGLRVLLLGKYTRTPHVHTHTHTP